jgi:mersacidin/lichenicidin family type 2 lantibiotic
MAIDIKRALEDAKYRATLTPEELAQLPSSARELTEDDLEGVSGGTGVVPPAKIQKKWLPAN